MRVKLTTSRLVDNEDKRYCSIHWVVPAVKTPVLEGTPIRQTVRRVLGLCFNQRLLRRFIEVGEVGSAGLRVPLRHTPTSINYFVHVCTVRCFFYCQFVGLLLWCNATIYRWKIRGCGRFGGEFSMGLAMLLFWVWFLCQCIFCSITRRLPVLTWRKMVVKQGWTVGECVRGFVHLP